MRLRPKYSSTVRAGYEAREDRTRLIPMERRRPGLEHSRNTIRLDARGGSRFRLKSIVPGSPPAMTIEADTSFGTRRNMTGKDVRHGRSPPIRMARTAKTP